MTLKVSRIGCCVNSKVTFGAKSKNNKSSIGNCECCKKHETDILSAGLIALAMIGASMVNTACNEPKITDNSPADIIEKVIDPSDIIEESVYRVPDYVVVDSKDKTRNNIWNIAKDVVSEGGTKEVTAPQINAKCNELLKVNGLKYPSDTCGVVNIADGQKIFTSADGVKHYTAEQIIKLLEKNGVLASPDRSDIENKNEYRVSDYVVVDSKDKTRNNIWNIAKYIVSEGGTKEVTAPQINAECNELLKVNGLKYPSDTCGVVNIADGQKIFTSQESIKNCSKE